MKEVTVTICDKPTGLAYCFATEMSFLKMAGISIDQMSITTPLHVICLIGAAHVAYCDSHKEKVQIAGTDLMYNAKPKEIEQALNEVLRMRMEWYEVPQAEIDATMAKLRGDGEKPKDKKKKKADPKNA